MSIVLLISILLVIPFILFYKLIKNHFPSLINNLLFYIVPKLSKSINKGIINFKSFNWCNLSLLINNNSIIPKSLKDITHPSIVYIKDGWNGYSHWLAATPYPQTLDSFGAPYENTWIFFSNNNSGLSHPINFESIQNNPIIQKEEAQYNSDPNLFFDIVSNKLFCITRKRHGPGFVTNIVLQSSKDGLTWSAPKSIITINTAEQFLSPCLIKFSSKYRIYAFQTEPTDTSKSTSIDIWESESLENPNFIFLKSIKWREPMNIWHGGLFEYGNKLYLIFCGSHNNYKYITGQRDISKYLFLGYSDDGENFNTYNNPILKMNGVYRSSAFVDENNNLVCYVSLHNRYRGEKLYASGNRIGMFVYLFDKLISELSTKANY